MSQVFSQLPLVIINHSDCNTGPFLVIIECSLPAESVLMSTDLERGDGDDVRWPQSSRAGFSVVYHQIKGADRFQGLWIPSWGQGLSNYTSPVSSQWITGPCTVISTGIYKVGLGNDDHNRAGARTNRPVGF